MKWYNAFVFAFGLAFAVALALFPKQAPAQEVLSARGLVCDPPSKLLGAERITVTLEPCSSRSI
jgi:hypothetical protein